MSVLEAIHFLLKKKTHSLQTNDHYNSNTHERKNDNDSLDQDESLKDEGL